MEQTLRELVAKIAETSNDFQADANLRDDLKIDSVRALELMFEIEREFKIQIPMNGYAQVRSFLDLLALAKSLKQLSR
ncbi:MAG TPA: acyl carrier protein [Anaeromyxobacteraceae bacterium]|nr:acyl carrier protein [Anaeromyxobacteraceae bacterium]